MTKPRFQRHIWYKYVKLGKRNRKNQKWRKPTGRHNKMREKRAGRPAVVSIGYGTDNRERKKIIQIFTLKDLRKPEKNEIFVLGKVGGKKKIEIAKKAKEHGIEIQNLNSKKFLRKLEREKNKENKK